MRRRLLSTARRIRALRRFALAITILNILGHTVLGFEQSYAQPIFCLLTTYSLELLLETSRALSQGKRPAFLKDGLSGFVNFMLPAHITGLAIGMLLYASDRILPFVFAATVAIGSKAVFRVQTTDGPRHFFNPSNFGITATLLAFPSVGIAPPYMFTEGLGPVLSVLFPLLVLNLGLFLNAKLTKRLPLILAWLSSFVLQALLRAWSGEALLPILNAMTGLAFILFTCYMVTDPATTPNKKGWQVLFGAGVGTAYGLLVTFHIVFGLFFGLTMVCLTRGIFLALEYLYSTHAVSFALPSPFRAAASSLPAAAPSSETVYSEAMEAGSQGG